MAVCAGIARKVSIPFVALATLGWVIFVVGFGLNNTRNDFLGLLFLIDSENAVDINFWPYWCFLLTGPILFINLAIHLIFGHMATGILTNFFTSFYLVHGGSILYFSGRVLFQNFNEDLITEENGLLFILVEWVGALISVLFLTIHMMFWPLFSDPKHGYSYRE